MLLTIPYFAHAQAPTDSTTKPAKKVYNTNKLELVTNLERYNKTEGYYPSFGNFLTFRQYVRVNNKRLVEIDKQGDVLRAYFSRCAAARAEVAQMAVQRRRGKAQMWSLFGAGMAITATSLIAGKTDGAKATGAYIGFGTALTGSILGFVHSSKSQKHLKNAIDVYNLQCYNPPAWDTVRKAKGPDSSSLNQKFDRRIDYADGDPVYYSVLRNEPQNAGLYGVILSPIVADINSLNVNVRAGITAFYTYKSLFQINATYNYAYLDMAKVAGDIEAPNASSSSISKGIPSVTNNAVGIDVLTKTSLFSWQQEKKYHMQLGWGRFKNLGFATVYGKFRGKISTAITGRVGYSYEQKMIKGSSTGDVQFNNTTPPLAYHGKYKTTIFTPQDLGNAVGSMKTNTLVVGLAYSKFRDLKVQLADYRYKGKREVRSQTDIYIDALIGQKIDIQDIVYYHYLGDQRASYNTNYFPQRLDVSSTPVSKIGYRVGASALNMWTPNFGLRTHFEVGKRPGPAIKNGSQSVYLQMGFGFIFGGKS